MLLVAACDERVRAVVAQVPAGGRTRRRPISIRSTLLTGDISATPETTVGPLPVVSFDQVGSPSRLTPLTAFRRFIEYGARHGSGWQNIATRVSPPVPEPFHAGLCAPHVTVPTLALISPDDEMPGANPAVARAAFEAVAGPCEILDIEGGHFGLLFHPSPEFDAALAAQLVFVRAHLYAEGGLMLQ